MSVTHPGLYECTFRAADGALKRRKFAAFTEQQLENWCAEYAQRHELVLESFRFLYIAQIGGAA